MSDSPSSRHTHCCCPPTTVHWHGAKVGAGRTGLGGGGVAGGSGDGGGGDGLGGHDGSGGGSFVQVPMKPQSGTRRRATANRG